MHRFLSAKIFLNKINYNFFGYLLKIAQICKILFSEELFQWGKKITIIEKKLGNKEKNIYINIRQILTLFSKYLLKYR